MTFRKVFAWLIALTIVAIPLYEAAPAHAATLRCERPQCTVYFTREETRRFA